MLYVQQFQNNRQDYLRQYQRFRLLTNDKLSLCSKQYIEKFSKLSQSVTSHVDYSHNSTSIFLSRIPLLETKSTTEDHQQIRITYENKDPMATSLKHSIQDEDKQISNKNNEKFSIRWRHQLSSNIYSLAKNTKKQNQLSTSLPLSLPILTETYRSPTAPLTFKESINRTKSVKLRSTTPSRSPTLLRTSCSIDSSDNFDNLKSSSLIQYKPTIFKSDNHFIHQSSTDTNIHMNDILNTNSQNSFLNLSIDTNSFREVTINNQDEIKIPHRDNQRRINGFQHIANLGSWKRNSKTREIECEEELSTDIDQSLLHSSKQIYEYKKPFSEEYDQAIALQVPFQTNNNNEWNLRDFYRDVKTHFEPDTNTKPVFEKCLKLARLQANTIKWEQRRRQNLNTYNRLIKNATLDNNILNLNGNFSSRNNNERDIRDINELRRELRCNECKRLACLGNCAPGQEYQQYKRFIPFSSLPNTRDQIRCKLALRTQRPTTDLRPRSTQQITRETKSKFEQTNLNSVVVVPLFENELPTKCSQKKFTNGYLPGKSFRSQRRETLTLISTHKILS